LKRVYLDHNATTPVDARVLERFLEVERAGVANPSSTHTAGRDARAVLERARQEIAEHLGVGADEVVFVSGGTEANNLAVLGTGPAERGVAASAAEHPSVLAAARRRGLAPLAVHQDGQPCFVLAQRPDEPPPAVVCCIYGQSEVGVLADLDAARGLADSFGATLHVDASQALGRVDLAPAVRVADTLTLSLHKAGGPRGVGLLIVRQRAGALRPLGSGGNQERGVRPGTVSPALAAAAAAAVSFAVTERAQRAGVMRVALHAFWTRLATLPGVTRVTPVESVLPNTLLLAFPCVHDGRMLLPAIDLAGVDASHGSACSSGSTLPPAVLLAMGHDEEMARRCVRFSFSHTTMIDAAQVAATRVHEAVARLMRA